MPNKGYSKKDLCEKSTGKKCEKVGFDYVAKCDAGWHRAMFGYCSKDCPNGMDDIGISCHKDIYLRDSVPKVCSKDEETVGLTCFPQCAPGLISDGASCWYPCPMGTLECGAACLHPSVNCASWIVQMIAGSVGTVVDVATSVTPVGGISRAIEGAGGLATSLSMPNCP